MWGVVYMDDSLLVPRAVGSLLMGVVVVRGRSLSDWCCGHAQPAHAHRGCGARATEGHGRGGAQPGGGALHGGRGARGGVRGQGGPHAGQGSGHGHEGGHGGQGHPNGGVQGWHVVPYKSEEVCQNPNPWGSSCSLVKHNPGEEGVPWCLREVKRWCMSQE